MGESKTLLNYNGVRRVINYGTVHHVRDYKVIYDIT